MSISGQYFRFETVRSLPPSVQVFSLRHQMLASAVCIAAAAAAAPFKHAPLPPALVELRDTLQDARETLQDALANPGLRDTLVDLHPLACLRRRSRDALRTLTVVDTSLHAATMGTVTGVEVLCGSIRTCYRSMRSPSSRTPQLKTGRVVCALCAGAPSPRPAAAPPRGEP